MVTLESMSGYHTLHHLKCLRFAFTLFVSSEAAFFGGIFWAYLDAALSPRVDVGITWVPIGILPINPIGIPLFNTVVLLTRSVTLTWAHIEVLSKGNAIPGCVLTLRLGACFLIAQWVEYSTATFSIADGVYGSVFYFRTGFHGLHVLVGLLFVRVASILVYKGYLTRVRCISIEVATLY